MNRMSVVAVLLSSFAVACAPDEHGDLRSRVSVQRDAGETRITFSGVGVGTGVEDAQRAFAGALDPMLSGSVLVWQEEADYGTRLDLLYSFDPDAGTIAQLVFVYTGNRVAIGKVHERWIEALGLGPDACGDRGCYWDDGEARVASTRRDTTWYGKATLTVTLDR